MTGARVHIRVAGVWLEAVAGWGDLEVTHGRNGPLEATWSMTLRDNERPHCLHRNARVELYSGTRLVSSGILGEPDWEAKSFVMIGTAREGEGAQCLNGSGAVTSRPNTAIDQAIARQVVSWTRISDFGNTDLAGPEGGAGTDDPQVESINALLDQWAVENNSQWRVTADGRLIASPEVESNPSWLILSGAAVLGVADDNLTDRVFLRYFDSGAGRFRTASFPATTPAGGIERRASITHLGPMSAARATSIAEGMWRKALEGRTGWTNGAEVNADQIVTLGNQPANLALLRAGQTVRLLDTADPRNGGRNLDVVLGETTWRPSERTIQLNPVGLVARTWEHILEEANAREAA